MNILMLFLILLELSSYILIGKGDEPINPKIIGGSDVKPGESKFMVSLRDRNSEKYSFGAGHFCGGSLVTLNKVLTAAHCLQNERLEWIAPEAMVAVLGILKRKKKDSSASVHDIGNYDVHGDFNSYNLRNDIALLLIKPSIDPKNPNIQTIPLPQQDTDVGKICKAIGWGYVKDPIDANPGEDLLADDLREAKLEIIDLPGCTMPFRICTVDNSGQQSACKGDSGSPLILNGVLVGITSGGLPRKDNYTCIAGNFGKFTNVYYYRSWYNNAASGLDKLSFATKSFHFLHVTLILLEILLHILI